MATDRSDAPARTDREPLLIDLALQGGGAHGAFTWGVLDRLLAEPRLRIEGISGTSAGAMNAAVLADALHRSPNDVPTALQRYERQRRPRVAQVAKASLRNGRIYHLSGVPALARDLALRKLPAQRLMARYDWLYGWRCD